MSLTFILTVSSWKNIIVLFSHYPNQNPKSEYRDEYPPEDNITGDPS